MVLGGVLVGGCATMNLSRKEALRQNDAVAQLSDGLEAARGRDGALLAPSLFEQTQEQLDDAVRSARKSENQNATDSAQKGMAYLRQLNEMIAKNSEEMEEVVDLRTRAHMQGAALLFEDRSEDADEKFREASRKLEDGETAKARETRPALIEKYAKLELDAMKKGTVEAAKKAIEVAEEADADKHAPKTLQKAREQLKLAVSVLDADRTQADKANTYADEALFLADRARMVTHLVKYYDSQSFTEEDRVLWYQSQLQSVRDALRDEMLPFDRPNSKVIQALRTDSLSLKSVMNESRRSNELAQQRVSKLEARLESQRRDHEDELQTLLALQDQQLAAMNSRSASRLSQAQRDNLAQAAALKERLSEQSMAQAEEERKEQRRQERFEMAQNLFDEGEAQVFRQGDNVLIRLKGFDFKPGKHDVNATNYGMLNKVVAAINTFPESTVEITGHTDSTGGDRLNRELSVKRAESVMGFLSTLGGVDTSRLTARGAGEEEPLASNENLKGRAENRRIDLLIVNRKARGGDVTQRIP